MADIKVIAHQQHGSGGELEDVLARAVGEDRLQASQAAGAHHNQIGIQFFGHLQHGLLGVAVADDRIHFACIQAHASHGLGKERCGGAPVFL